MTVTNVEPDWGVLFQPWENNEGELRPERDWTPWAHPGWMSWNSHAAEFQVADFLANVASMSSAGVDQWVCLETGVGQGYVTRRIVSAVNPTMIRGIWVYESDPEWAGRIRQLPYWPDNLHSCIKWEITPTPKQMQQADLVILDSRKPWRQIEMMMWSEVGKEGSLLYVHDVGTPNLPHQAGHSKNRFLIEDVLELPGLWMDNPRGGFLAQKGSAEPESKYKELWDRTVEQVHAFE